VNTYDESRPMVFRVLELTCAVCDHVERVRCREVGESQVLSPCSGCGRPRAIGTKVVRVRNER
jgi:hypothetical protein